MAAAIEQIRPMAHDTAISDERTALIRPSAWSKCLRINQSRCRWQSTGEALAKHWRSTGESAADLDVAETAVPARDIACWELGVDRLND